MANAINWFEIPASDFNRAVKFYSDIFGQQMPASEMMGTKFAFFHAAKTFNNTISLTYGIFILPTS